MNKDIVIGCAVTIGFYLVSLALLAIMIRLVCGW